MKNDIVRVVLGAALAIGLMLPMGISTSADRDWGAPCRNRLESARAKLEHDASRYGPDSPRVNRDRERLESARQWCRDHRADWDHSRFDVGIYLRK